MMNELIYFYITLGFALIEILIIFIVIRRNKILLQKNILLAIEKMILEDNIETLEKEKESILVEESDGFIKFLSESREWAFNYIEDVQKEVSEFIEVASTEFEYINTYGKILGTPIDKNIEKIYAAYKKLETLMPEDKPNV